MGVLPLEYRWLGDTGLKVSRLCFGALTIGPLQAGLPLLEGAKVIRRALEQGVNFIDTARLYGTYGQIRAAMGHDFKDVVVTSKSYAYTALEMESHLREAVNGLGRDYIDIFLLHEQESDLTILGHWEAVEYLLRAREKGLVRAIGISTHSVSGVKAAATVAEFGVIHPLVNVSGIGIVDGSLNDMLVALKEAYQAGKGLYGMKALGGGNLLARADESLDFVLELDELAAVAVGMQSVAEVDYNVAFFSQRKVPTDLKKRLSSVNRRLHIEDWCQGCGSCLEKCSKGALRLERGKLVVDQANCRLCGYCGAACPEFCIKIV